MSRNGSGVYSLPAGNPVVTGTTISSSWANTTLSDIATALTGSVASDGQTPMTGNLQMGSNKVTGLAVATTSGDALSYGQAATVTDLTVTGNATVGGTLTLTGGLTLNGNVTVGDSSSDTLTVNATSTFAAGATFSSTFAANGGVTLGDASGDALTINSSAVSIPNGLNFDSDTFVIDATNNRVGVGTSSPSTLLDVRSSSDGALATFRRIGATVNPGLTIVANETGSTVGFNTVYTTSSPAYTFSIGGTERMRLDSSGNLGLGVTPSAWYSNITALQVGNRYGSIFGGSGYSSAPNISVAANTYAISSTGVDTYIATAVASKYTQGNGTHAWYTAPSGTAGTAITFTQAMTLDSSGRLGIGTSSPARKLDISDSTTDVAKITTSSVSDSILLSLQGGSGVRQRFLPLGGSGNYNWQVAASTNVSNAFEITPSTASGGSTFSTPAFLIAGATGNVGIGTSSPSYKLDVIGASRGTSLAADSGSSGGAGTITSYYQTSSNPTILGQFVHTGDANGLKIISTRGSTGGAGSDVIAFLNGATPTERMRLDSSGNLGLGVTPSTWSTGKAIEVGAVGNAIFGWSSSDISVASGAYYNGGWKWSATSSLGASHYEQYSGGHYWNIAAPTSHTAGTAVTFTQAMTLDASGNLGIGTTSPSSKLDVLAAGNVLGRFKGGGTLSALYLADANTTTDTLYIGTVGNDFRIITNSAERMRIDSSGNLLVGTTSMLNSGQRLSVLFATGNNTGSTWKHPDATGGAAPGYLNFFNSSGTQVGYIACNGSATTYSTSSDYRLKENIAPMTGALDKVCALKPITYTWKNSGLQGQGFIAHELQAVVPDCVTGEKDAVELVDIKDEEGNVIGQEERPVYQGIDTSFLVATLTAAIQELKAEVDSLKAQLNK